MKVAASKMQEALLAADAPKEQAQAAAAELGGLYVEVKSNTTRLNFLIGLVIAQAGLVIGVLFQIAFRLP